MKVRYLIVSILLILLSGCQYLDYAKAVNSAALISASVQLEESYVLARDDIVRNIDIFTEEERASLTRDEAQLKAWQTKLTEIKEADSNSEKLLLVGEALPDAKLIGSTFEAIISVVEPKAHLLDRPDSFYRAKINYQRVASTVSNTMDKGSRRERTEFLLRAVEAVIVIITAIKETRSNG